MSAFEIFRPDRQCFPGFSPSLSAGSPLAHLVGPNVETLQGIGTEGAADSGVGGGFRGRGRSARSPMRGASVAGVEGIQRPSR